MPRFWITLIALALAGTVRGQEAASRDPAVPSPDLRGRGGGEDSPAKPGIDRAALPLTERLFAPFRPDDDPDGPIITDRPSFTPANTVVPRGRLQVESGYTFTHNSTRTTRTDSHSFPELAVRAGLSNRLEFRTFWNGQTYTRTLPRSGGPVANVNGPSDMEVGFKTQLLQTDEDRKWRPTTALITSVMAPTGGGSPYSSGTVNPYANLLYGWNLTDKLTLAGSTGYQAMRQRNTGAPADSFDRFNQSLVAYYTPKDGLTLFHEWYVFALTNAADNRPFHNMDTGLLYRPTPNTQFDLRAGLGLGDTPSDFFAGAGFSIRF